MMTEEYWMNSQLSVVRFYGHCMVFGHEYMVADMGDLVRKDFLRFYVKLKRDRFMEILKQNPMMEDKELKTIYKEACKDIKKTKVNEQELFKYEK